MTDSYFIDRYKYDDLIPWKNSSVRKPLIILGAQQVGKTWLVRKFSEKFEYFAEINFEFLQDAKAIFTKLFLNTIKDHSLSVNYTEVSEILKELSGKIRYFISDVKKKKNK